jgi:hypothetical protein
MKTFMNIIINTGYIPSKLNTSLIIPIIKTKIKIKFDKNNYRPISVSNVIAQIREKIIRFKCPAISTSLSNQFRLENSMTTLHPLFLLKETIQNHKLTEKPLYIASKLGQAYDSYGDMVCYTN